MKYRIAYKIGKNQDSHIVQALNENGAREVFSNDPQYPKAEIVSVELITD